MLSVVYNFVVSISPKLVCYLPMMVEFYYRWRLKKVEKLEPKIQLKKFEIRIFFD